MTTNGTKSTEDCRLLWLKVEGVRTQMLFSVVQVSEKGLGRSCKLTAGCITVAVVDALAFITVVISMRGVSKKAISRIKVQKFFWTNF